jgi:hypothetical protein
MGGHGGSLHIPQSYPIGSQLSDDFCLLILSSRPQLMEVLSLRLPDGIGKMISRLSRDDIGCGKPVYLLNRHMVSIFITGSVELPGDGIEYFQVFIFFGRLNFSMILEDLDEGFFVLLLKKPEVFSQYIRRPGLMGRDRGVSTQEQQKRGYVQTMHTHFPKNKGAKRGGVLKLHLFLPRRIANDSTECLEDS